MHGRRIYYVNSHLEKWLLFEAKFVELFISFNVLFLFTISVYLLQKSGILCTWNAQWHRNALELAKVFYCERFVPSVVKLRWNDGEPKRLGILNWKVQLCWATSEIIPFMCPFWDSSIFGMVPGFIAGFKIFANKIFRWWY